MIAHKPKFKIKVKIPLRFAPALGHHASHLVRINQGERRIQIPQAIKAVDLFAREGVAVSILDLRPDLEALLPYICPLCPPDLAALPVVCPQEAAQKKKVLKRLIRQKGKKP